MWRGLPHLLHRQLLPGLDLARIGGNELARLPGARIPVAAERREDVAARLTDHDQGRAARTRWSCHRFSR